MKKLLSFSVGLLIFASAFLSCKNDSLKSGQMSNGEDKSYSDQNNDNQKIKKLNMNYSVSHMEDDSKVISYSDIAYCQGNTYIMGYSEDFGDSTTITETDLVSHEKKEYIINEPSAWINNIFISD